VSRRDRIELTIWIAVLMLAVVVVGQQPGRLSGDVLRQPVLRQIDDPGAHGIWLLTRDPVHPAGPGRMVWVPDRVRLEEGAGSAAAAVLREPAQTAIKPVILAGDRVVVEEETPVVDARLAATALNPAPAGMGFNARLEIGGQVVRAIAVGPGLAQLAPETGAQP
jgi:hypothetical protein